MSWLSDQIKNFTTDQTQTALDQINSSEAVVQLKGYQAVLVVFVLAIFVLVYLVGRKLKAF